MTAENLITKDRLLMIMADHIGRENGIHVTALVARLTGSDVIDTALERRIRALVTDLRLDGAHICAHPAAGYFMASTPQELNETCEFLYERAMTSLTQVSRMKNISLPDLRGQLHLPT